MTMGKWSQGTALFLVFFLSIFGLFAQDENRSETICSDDGDKYSDYYRISHPDVYHDSCWYGAEPQTDCEYARAHGISGVWLPEGPPLFRPFIADPRQITSSVGWR